VLREWKNLDLIQTSFISITLKRTVKNNNQFPSFVCACFSGFAASLSSVGALELEPIGRYGQTDSDAFDESAAEIPTYDPVSKRLFVTNAATASVDAIDLTDPENPTLLFSISLADDGISGPTSVTFTGGFLAVALAAEPKTDNGFVAFFDADGNSIAPPVEVGALPDAVTASPDGSILITSNEGEPNDDNTIDPEGSVSIIDISEFPGSASVTTLGFGDFNASEDELKAAGIRIFGRIYTPTGGVDEDGDPVFTSVPGTVAEDLEPEYAAISPDGSTAFVTLQENNAVAVVNFDGVGGPSIEGIFALGLKDHFISGNELNPSNRDKKTKIKKHKVLGMYQPDAIASYEAGGVTYFVTANEGDARDYDNFSEEIRANDLADEGFSFKGGKGLVKNEKMLGRLTTTTAPPETAIAGEDKNGNQVLKNVVAFGTRSFSIWSSDGVQVFDSGADFADLTSWFNSDLFNASHDDPEADNRSDDKGPEPEGIIVATIEGKSYAFVTLERVGGIMVYDISDPAQASFSGYFNTRLPASDENNSTIEDDLGPEGLVFIDASDSPNNEPLLVVTNEVSGSTVVFQINP
jgi:DNA-binding beta-propeller fold protein YncE